MLGRLWVLVSLCCLVGCSAYVGDGRSIRPEALRSEPGWLAVRDLKLIEQENEYDCGPAALAMVLARYDDAASERVMAREQRGPASAGELRDLARSLGYAAFVVEGTARDLVFELQRGRPMIVGMIKPTFNGPVAHYEVVIGIHADSRRIATLDPALGWRQTPLGTFIEEWQGSGSVLLVVMPQTPAQAAHVVAQR